MSGPPPQRLHSTTQGSGGPFRQWRARRKAKLSARSTLRKVLTRGGIGLALLVVVVAGGGAGYYYYRSDQVHRVPTPHEVVSKGPIENILLIGSTSRCAASAISVYKQQCLHGVNGVNSDVVLVARLNARTDKIKLISIPRDTFVPGARSGSALCGSTSPLTPGLCANKIDSALVEGPDQLIAAIEQDYGIPINHFIDLNFATFTNVVNALGGLKMYFPDRLFDASSGLRITRTGCQLLNGTQALALVRSRHLYWFSRGQQPNYEAIQAANDDGSYLTSAAGGSYDGTGDLGRIVRVHLFLTALAQQVAARGLGNPLTDNNLIGAVAPNLTVDAGLSTTDMVHLAVDFKDAHFGSTPELTVPTITYGQTYYYHGVSYGDVIFPSEPQDQRLIDQFLGTEQGASLSPSSISVSVVDGTNSSTETASVAAQLRALGYRTVPTSMSDYVGPVSETTVLYAPGHLDQAERVLRSLSGAVVLGQGKPVGGADVTVVAGSLLSVAKPAPSAPSSTATTPSTSGSTAPAGSASTTTTTPPETGQPSYSYNAASAAIPSFDPRSCPAS